MMGIKRIEKIRGDEITAGVAIISEEIREAIPRLLGHVEKKVW